jgi:competence protein ComEA
VHEKDDGGLPAGRILLPMPTPSEQKALAFIAIVMLLGGAVRVLRAGSSAPPTSLEQQALARQATAADSAKLGARRGKTSRRGKSARASRDTIPVVVGGVASVPPTYARPDRPFDHAPYGFGARLGFSPASPRIDTDANGMRPTAPAAPPSGSRKQLPAAPVDMDFASAQEIEALPRIGPALAHRIVANRDSFGAFGSLDKLRRVKGMGPASLDRLAPLVTFGGRAAPRAAPP